jgi:hypothetical protein
MGWKRFLSLHFCSSPFSLLTGTCVKLLFFLVPIFLFLNTPFSLRTCHPYCQGIGVNFYFCYCPFMLANVSSMLMWHRCRPSIFHRTPFSFLVCNRFRPLRFLSTTFSLLAWHSCRNFIFLSTHWSLLTCHPFLCGMCFELFLVLLPLYISRHVTLANMHMCWLFLFLSTPLSLLAYHPC